MKKNKKPTNEEVATQHLKEITRKAHEAYGEQSTVTIVNGHYIINTNIPVPEYNWELNKNSYAHIAYSTHHEEWDNDYYAWTEANDRWHSENDHVLVPRYEKEAETLVNYMRIGFHQSIKNDPNGSLAKEYRKAYPNDELKVAVETFIPDSQTDLTREQRILRYKLITPYS